MSDDVEDIAEDQDDPAVAPKSARAWLSSITQAEKAFSDYQGRADNIDKMYASLKRLSDMSRDREFQLFWANIQVLGPSVYARPPVPVVVPRFKDRRPLYRVSSELLERCSIVTFEMSDIDAVMLLLRDDLNILARGAAWVRYETKAEGEHNTERTCIDYLDRRDFLHEPSRNWLEVGWVARRAWMTRREMRKRFLKTSGDAYQDAEFIIRKEDRDNGAASNAEQAGVWEIWSKTHNKVVWIAEGCDVLLDDDKPHLKLEGFFPCPRPAYGTTQRGSLVPVPDMVYYKDQLEEINELTGRIHALSGALQVRGFYPAGAGEIGDAIEAALKSTDNRQVMVPISNWAAFGGGAAKDTIVWLPLDMIVTTLAQLVELRRQLIDDVYQIMGLSDIMRGSTEASETLGAQQIKAQYGSVRIRDKQKELVRIARDLARIAAEIMAENFDAKTLLDMSQLEIPTDADIARQIEQLTAQAEQTFQQQVQQALQAPEAQQMAQQNPEQAQALMAQAQQQILAQLQPQIDKLEKTPTIEKVAKFLRDQRLRPFVLDIETDSTIQPDEDAAKQRATEFITAVGGFMQQAVASVSTVPESAPLAAEMLKYVASQFRAGRQMESTIEEFADTMKEAAKQPRPNPEAMKAEADAKAAEQAAQIESQRAQTEALTAQGEAEAKRIENAERAQALQAKAAKDADDAAQRQADMSAKAEMANLTRAQAAEKHQQDMEIGALNYDLLALKIDQTSIATENSIATTEAGIAAKDAATSQTGTVEPKRPASSGKRVGPLERAIEQMASGQVAIAQALDGLAAAQSAPTEIIRDPSTGRPIGARKVMS